MVAPVKIIGDAGRPVRVTKFGQLVVSPIDYSAPVFDEVDSAGSPFNFIVPKTGQDIVITDILISTDRSTPNAGTRVEVYSALSATTLTAEQNILIDDMARQDRITATGLNLFVPGGRWVNVQADNATGRALVTIMFYRVPKLD